MLHLSKSKYCGLWQCPKMAWLRKYKPEEAVADKSALARFRNGSEVGELAKGIFGDFVDVTAYSNDKIDPSQMISNTKAELQKGTGVICEASFEAGGLYCAVDILRKDGAGYAIYEVKSSTESDKAVYLADVAYQKYVLEKCGIKITGTYLMTLNKEYVLDGNLDISKLFKISNVDDAILTEAGNIEPCLELAEKVLTSEIEPDIDLSMNCNKPYKCTFWKYCTRELPQPSVFNLHGPRFSTKLKYYSKGIISYDELENCGEIKDDKPKRQIDYHLHDKGTFVNKSKIHEVLDKLHYPLYFLDFETMQPAVPVFQGTKPYQQIPFQYSLHYYESEGSELMHKEFLAESGVDQRRQLAEKLCADIPMDVCVTAYNKAFECSRIKELAEMFPDLAEHLLNIEKNIVDLIVPFRSGYYYKKEMEGSASIKKVLTALFPNDPALDYRNLNGVHEGTEAMTIFPQIKDMPPEEQKEARHNLLKYCELDTYAMVKIWEKLVEAGI